VVWRARGPEYSWLLCAGQAQSIVDAPPNVVSTADSVHDDGFDRFPVVHDLPKAHPQDRIALAEKLQIASPISLVVVTEVMSPAVELKYESIANQDVDPANTVDFDLGANAEAVAPQSQSRKCLQPGLCPRVDQIEDSLIRRRKVAQNGPKFRQREQRSTVHHRVQRRVDAHYRDVSLGTLQELSDRVAHAISSWAAERIPRTPRPMQTNVGMRVRIPNMSAIIGTTTCSRRSGMTQRPSCFNAETQEIRPPIRTARMRSASASGRANHPFRNRIN